MLWHATEFHAIFPRRQLSSPSRRVDKLANEVLAIAIAGLINLGFYVIQLALYRWERNKGYVGPRETSQVSIADPTQTRNFLALEDYYAGRWGDTIGLTAMNIGVGGVLYDELQFVFWMPIPSVFAIALSIGYYNYCRSTNKNDWTFTRGKITWAGVAHLVYIFYQVSVGALGVGLLASGKFDTFIIVALAGGLFYLLTFTLDVRAGKHGLNRRRPGSEAAT